MTFPVSSYQAISPRFGQINLERFYDNEGAQHSYIELNLSKNRYDYYFSHQLNSIQTPPIPALTTLTERYQPQDLTNPSVFNGFKRDLLAIVEQAQKAFSPQLDDYSKDELSSVQALLTRPDSFIRKSNHGDDYLLSIPHSNNALRGMEGLAPTSTINYFAWPPPDPSMGVSKNTQLMPNAQSTISSNPALTTRPAVNPASINSHLPSSAGSNPGSAPSALPQPIDSTPWS